VADGPASVILEQVTNGVAVRMAALFRASGLDPGALDEAGEEATARPGAAGTHPAASPAAAAAPAPAIAPAPAAIAPAPAAAPAPTTKARNGARQGLGGVAHPLPAGVPGGVSDE
jgi:hypothetical protein